MVKVTGMTSGTIGTQTTHAHGWTKAPLAYSLKSKGNGVVYESIAADATNIYVKCSAASIAFEAILFF